MASHMHTRLLCNFSNFNLNEMESLHFQAPEPLLTFLNYLTYGYMIDNVVLILAGVLHGRDVKELVEKCHPLGMFNSILTLSVATNMQELYKLILVDTPLAPYFDDCMTLDIDESNIEILRNTLHKAYMNDFLHLCKSLGGSTSRVMTELLSFEADRRAVEITINSLGTDLSRDDRRRLFPEMGKLHPFWHHALASCDDYDQVRSVVEENPERTSMASPLAKLAENAVEKWLNEEEMRICRLALQQNAQYAGFFAYAKMREQELKNIMWIAECIAQQQKDRLSDCLVPVSSYKDR